jgi:hypothetical protein
MEILSNLRFGSLEILIQPVADAVEISTPR